MAYQMCNALDDLQKDDGGMPFVHFRAEGVRLRNRKNSMDDNGSLRQLPVKSPVGTKNVFYVSTSIERSDVKMTLSDVETTTW